jgi:hypothetical protein
LGLYPRHQSRVPHIFREMWDTQASPSSLSRVLQLRTGAPCSHQRTWAENDGRSPTTAFRSGPTRFSSGSEIRGSVVERLRLGGSFLEMFFDRAKRRRGTCGFISWYPTHPLKPRWQSVDRFTTFSGRLNPEAAILSGLHSDACAIADVTEAVSRALCLSPSLHRRAAESGASTPLPRMSTKIWGIRFGFPHFKKRIAG